MCNLLGHIHNPVSKYHSDGDDNLDAKPCFVNVVKLSSGH